MGNDEPVDIVLENFIIIHSFRVEEFTVDGRKPLKKPLGVATEFCWISKIQS